MPQQEGMLDPSSRPTRLKGWAYGMTMGFLGITFISGVLVWRGMWVQEEILETPDWLRWAMLVHGGMNPVMCILFGYLLCHHIREGWKMRANWVTGLVMELNFGLLIGTGVGLYYAGGESMRWWMEVSHRVMGVALPVTITCHLLAAKRWVKNL